MDRTEKLTYYLALEKYAQKNAGEIVLVNNEGMIVFYPFENGKKYSKYIIDTDFDESLKKVTQYDSLTELSNS